MTRWLTALFIVVCLIANCAAPKSGSDLVGGVDSADSQANVPVALAPCDDYVGGPIPMSTDIAVEAFPNYDEELAALDLSTLPAEIDLSTEDSLRRGIVAYMLEQEFPELPSVLDRDTLLAAGPMGKAVLAAYMIAQNKGDEGIDLVFLRRGLHRYYQCVRAFPLTLEGFKKAIYDYTDDSGYFFESGIKDSTRYIRENHELLVYIAETVDAEDEADPLVRETEILLGGRRSDSALDFLVYDHDGKLMDRSPFMAFSGDTVVGSAPYTCMSCHIIPGAFSFGRIFPDM